MSNSTFVGPVRSENGFLQQDESGNWVPISGGGGGGGGGTEHLTGGTGTAVSTRDDNYATIPYWNGVDGPGGANPVGQFSVNFVGGSGSGVSYQRMTINEAGQVTANTSLAGPGVNEVAYTTTYTTVGGTTTKAEIILPSDGFLANSRLTALYVYTEGVGSQGIQVYQGSGPSSLPVSSGTLVAGYMQNLIQWDGSASSFKWVAGYYPSWSPGLKVQVGPLTSWTGVSTLHIAAVLRNL